MIATDISLFEEISDTTKQFQELEILANKIAKYIKYFTSKLVDENGEANESSPFFRSSYVDSSYFEEDLGDYFIIPFNEIVTKKDKIRNNPIINKMIGYGKLFLCRGKYDFSVGSLILDIPLYANTKTRGASINGVILALPYFEYYKTKLNIFRSLISKKDYSSLIFHELSHMYDSEKSNNPAIPKHNTHDEYLLKDTELRARANEIIKDIKKYYENLFEKVSEYKKPKSDDEFDDNSVGNYHLGFSTYGKYGISLDKENNGLYLNYVKDSNQLFRMQDWSMLSRYLKFNNAWVDEIISSESIKNALYYAKKNNPEIINKLLEIIHEWFIDFLDRNKNNFPTKLIK